MGFFVLVGFLVGVGVGVDFFVLVDLGGTLVDVVLCVEVEVVLWTEDDAGLATKMRESA